MENKERYFFKVLVFIIFVILFGIILILGSEKEWEDMDDIDEEKSYYFSFTVTKEKGELLNTYTYVYDFETRKVEEKFTIPYTSQYPLTVYLDSKDEIYYTHRKNGEGDDEVYCRNQGETDVEKLTDSLFAVNYIFPFDDKVYLVAVENGTRAMGLFRYKNGKIQRLLKDEDAFVWQVNYSPKLEKIVFNTYSQSEFDENMENNKGDESYGSNKIYELDLKTEKIHKVADVDAGYMTAIVLDSSGDIYYQIGDFFKLENGESEKTVLFEELQMDKIISIQNGVIYYISLESEIIGYHLETREKEVIYKLQEENAAINNAVLLRKHIK